MRKLILAAVLCLTAAPAVADKPIVVAEENADLIKQYDPQLWRIQIAFRDGVTDGCLPNPTAIRTTMELRLRSARISPTDEFSPWRISILATGNKLIYGDGSATGSCKVNLAARFENWRWFYSANSREAYYLQVPILRHNASLVGPKGEMQGRVKETVSDIMDLYANENLKAIQQK